MNKEEELVHLTDINNNDYQIKRFNQINISNPQHIKILCEKLREGHYYQNFINELMNDHFLNNKMTGDFHRLNRRKRSTNTIKDDKYNYSDTNLNLDNSMKISSKDLNRTQNDMIFKRKTSKNLKETENEITTNELNAKFDHFPKIDSQNQPFLRGRSTTPIMISLPNNSFKNRTGPHPKNELPVLCNYNRETIVKHESNVSKDNSPLSKKSHFSEINEKRNSDVDLNRLKDDDTKKTSNDNFEYDVY